MIELLKAPGAYKLVKLSGECPMPSSGFCSLTCTPEELSLVCDYEFDAPGQTHGPLAMYRVAGVIDMGAVGVMSAISDALARSDIPVIVISTYNTDYILFRTRLERKAVRALRDAGIDVKSQ